MPDAILTFCLLRPLFLMVSAFWEGSHVGKS